MAQPTRNNLKYVYDLPYFERMELCRILDQNDKWEELGGIYMNFDVLTIQTLRREVLRGNSPADELLTKWGHQNHTILELFVLLSKMQHYQAMLIIKQFVDPQYHRLIHEGEQNLNRLMQSRCPKNQIQNVDFHNQVLPPLNSIGQRLQGPPCAGHGGILNSNNTSRCENETVQIDQQEEDPNNDERKILNNEPEQPRPSNHGMPKNRDPQSAGLVNREENAAAATDGNELLRPRLVKGESTKDRNMSEISSIAESVGILPLITFKELEAATNGWDQSAILGKGGFGTVYKGTWKNTQVAIKRTKNSDSDENRTAQIQQILGELKMLNSYRHDNILPLYGFSLGAVSSCAEEPCLIYQYMPNGSLEDRLLCRQGTKPLTWFQRHNIATGTARGLQFLHTIGEKPLIHGDIKSANILLDSNFEPKIGDFGLAREGPHSHYTHMKVSRVHGTRPYLPDEFLRHKKFSTKVDTYSFGIVLFELGTGWRAYDDQRQHKFLKDLIENSSENELGLLIDRKGGPDEHEIFGNLIALGKCCTSRKPKERPEMVTVLQELNAMTVKRDTIAKVHNMMKHNSVSPLNPFEVQVIHDHLSQQKRSPFGPSGSTVNRAISPLQPSALPAETSRGASPVLNENPLPFVPPLDPARNESPHRREVRTPSPAINLLRNQFGVEKPENVPAAVAPRPSPSNLEARQAPPVISVSPPSGSATSTISSDESSQDTDKIQNEDYDYQYSSQFDNVLPLISELGIKPKSDKKPEDGGGSGCNEQTPDVQTSAKSKVLWILEENG